MMIETPNRRTAAIGVVFACFCVLLPHAVLAHAVLVKSTPAARAQVKPGDVTITLTYNSRIDASRSSVALLRPDGKRETLTVDPHAGPNVLTSKAVGLSAGTYVVQWQVLATDGHITRGNLEFRVD
jgi:copper resistance protein C